MNKKVLAIFFAILAAGLYAINIPLSKLLLKNIAPTMMASYLYLGAGLGIGCVFLLTKKNQKEKRCKERLEDNRDCSWGDIGSAAVGRDFHISDCRICDREEQ